MFFIRFSRLQKLSPPRIFLRKFSRPADCPHTESGEKRPYNTPDCSKVIVVGGTGAVGLATATQLLCSKASHIALIDTDTCKGRDAVYSLNCAFGKGKAVFIKADVTNKCEIHDALRRARSEFKKIDAIVNAFGVWNGKKWEEEIQVNLVGTINVNEYASQIISNPKGFVLNIIGLPGIEIFSPSPTIGATNLAVVAYTQARGHERNECISGIRTVALCCGVTESNFSKGVESKTCCPQTGNDLKKYLEEEACWQKPEVVAKAVVEVLKFAPSGTVWVVEGSRLFSLKWPDSKTFRTLENQFI
ncbi:unnamed protein product [Ceutorhynchus assimilis]|uniref:Uncharacterized protein n=1 Tax=Ceutorhynchus assimilis TaxID=467358 RepID=A0A9N9MCB2_9CUCU|nr:unnamed protein product [Ceutorhynchus assimilis]